jgi:hypothetical protein
MCSNSVWQIPHRLILDAAERTLRLALERKLRRGTLHAELAPMGSDELRLAGVNVVQRKTTASANWRFRLLSPRASRCVVGGGRLVSY